jgi:hypothetical protein
MIVYDYDSNAILAEPLTSRNESDLLRAYTKLHTYLTERGPKPVLQKLDNETPGKLQSFMRQNDVSFQLGPPQQHRRNAAKRAIATWKDHSVATLATTDPDFPLHLWCRLIDQVTTTLNLLRSSQINPRLSAEAQLNAAFDYNKTPFAPPGTKVIIHEDPEHRRTLASHGGYRWYLGRAQKHYRCHRVYVSKTVSTVDFFPHHCTIPQTASADAARKAASALTHALQNPAPATPFAHIGNDQMQALKALAQIFATTVTKRHPAALRVANKEPPPPVLHSYPLWSRPTAPSLRVPDNLAPASPRVPIAPQTLTVSH